MTNTPTVTNTPTITQTPTITNTSTVTSTSTNTPTQTPTQTPTNTALVPQGGACATPSQCATGNCADGVCCNTACDQPLQQCNLPGQVGTCASTAAGAPAMTFNGLLAAAAVLAGIAALALRPRRRRG